MTDVDREFLRAAYAVARREALRLRGLGHVLAGDVDDVVQDAVIRLVRAAPKLDRVTDGFVRLFVRRVAWGRAARNPELARRFAKRDEGVMLRVVESGCRWNGRRRWVQDASDWIVAVVPSHEDSVIERVTFERVFDAWLDERPSRAEPRGDTRQARAARRASFTDFGRRFVARSPRAEARN